MKKTVNPYEKKKSTKRRRITRKQRTALLCVLLAAVLLIGLAVVSRAALSQAGSDPHAGHNHAEGEDCNATTADPHAGHSHGATNAGTSGSKLRYQLYKSGDTYSYAIYGAKNELLLKKDKLPMEPVKMPANDNLTLVYFKSNEQGYTAGETVYCDEKNGRISDAFHGAIDTDGVRVAYCNADDTAVIVQDLFDKSVYYREYPLEDVYTGGEYAVVNGRLNDNKTVTVSYYVDEKRNEHSVVIPLYQ